MKSLLIITAFSLSLASLFPAYAEVPALSLKDSIPIAEQALANTDVKLQEYFLFSIVYTQSSKGSFWNYTFRPRVSTESGGYDQIYVKVYMDGGTDLSGGPFSEERY